MAKSFHFDLTIESSALAEVLRVVLHAILFQRVLGTLPSRDFDLYGLSFVGIAEPSLSSLIDSKVDGFVKSSSADKGTILVRWMEVKRVKKSSTTGWFASSHTASELDSFEQWCLNLTVRKGVTERGRVAIEDQTREDLAAFQMKSLAFCQAEREHIPPITNAQLNPFPLDILINPKPSEIPPPSTASSRSRASSSAGSEAPTAGWLRAFSFD